MREFKVGDEVTVWSGGYGPSQPIKLRTVAKIGARKLTLNDGSHWTADGLHPWGKSRIGWNVTESIDPRRTDDAQRIKRANLLSRVRHFSAWQSMSDESLEAIAQIIKDHEDKRSAKPEGQPNA